MSMLYMNYCPAYNIIYMSKYFSLQIQSSNTEERLCGLQSLVTLSEKPESVNAIIKLKVLKVVSPLLVDSNSEVRNFTAGILRLVNIIYKNYLYEKKLIQDLFGMIESSLRVPTVNKNKICSIINLNKSNTILNKI